MSVKLGRVTRPLCEQSPTTGHAFTHLAIPGRTDRRSTSEKTQAQVRHNEDAPSSELRLYVTMRPQAVHRAPVSTNFKG